MLPHPTDSMAAGENMSNLTCSDSIEDFRSQVYPITYSVVSILGFLGNGLVLCVLIRTYHERTSFQIYMINLAVSDLLFVCTLPLRAVYYFHKGDWFFGDILCRISSSAMYINLYCSIFFMTAMSFFRCVAIVFPIRNLHFITEKKARFICVGIWIFVTLITCPFMMTGTFLENNKTKCFEPPQREGPQMLKLLVLHYIAFFIGFAFPFSVITVCYTMIIRTLLKKPKHNQTLAHTKAVWMIVVVTLAFLVSFTPYHIQRTIHLHFLMGKDSTCDEDVLHMQKSVVITLSLAAFNCCFDPLLYFFSGGNFRKRLSTFRKASSSSMHVPKTNVSLKHFEDETVKENGNVKEQLEPSFFLLQI